MSNGWQNPGFIVAAHGGGISFHRAADFEDDGKLDNGGCPEADKNATSGVWMKRGDGYLHAEGAKPELPAGMYRVHCLDAGIFFQEIEDAGDDLLDWPGSVVSEVMADIQQFWTREPAFHEMGLTHKRGMLLYGPPGSGKTSVLRAVARAFVAGGGIVIFDQDPGDVANGLQLLRKKEPNRPILVLFEDFEELLGRAHHLLLSMLDGELQIGRVVYLATTNYPDKLPPRIVNRPSRFDVLKHVGMPDADGRKAFLLNRCPQLFEAPDGWDVDGWVADTDEFSMAHLKEMIISVRALGIEYGEVLKRLKDMVANKSITPDPERPGHFMQESDNADRNQGRTDRGRHRAPRRRGRLEHRRGGRAVELQPAHDGRASEVDAHPDRGERGGVAGRQDRALARLRPGNPGLGRRARRHGRARSHAADLPTRLRTGWPARPRDQGEDMGDLVRQALYAAEAIFPDRFKMSKNHKEALEIKSPDGEIIRVEVTVVTPPESVQSRSRNTVDARA